MEIFILIVLSVLIVLITTIIIILFVGKKNSKPVTETKPIEDKKERKEKKKTKEIKPKEKKEIKEETIQNELEELKKLRSSSFTSFDSNSFENKETKQTKQTKEINNTKIDKQQSQKSITQNISDPITNSTNNNNKNKNNNKIKEDEEEDEMTEENIPQNNTQLQQEKIEEKGEEKKEETIQIQEENDEKNKLNKQSLGNVMYYLHDYKQVIDFIQINKKCQESMKEININPRYSIPPTKLEFPRTIFSEHQSMLKELELFKEMKVFEVYGSSAQMQLAFTQKKKVQLALKTFRISRDIEDIDKDDRDRFIEIRYMEEDPIKLITFHNLQRATIRILNDNKVKQYLLRKQHLESIRFIFDKNIDFDFINSFDLYHVKQLIVENNNKNQIQQLLTNEKMGQCKERVVVITSVDISTLNNPHQIPIISSNQLKMIPTKENVPLPNMEKQYEIIDCQNDTFKESHLKQIKELPNKSRVRLIHMKANETFNLKSCTNLLGLDIVDSEIDTIVDVNDIYPSSLEELSSPFDFIPQQSNTLRIVTIKNHKGVIDMMKYTNLDMIKLEHCQLKEKMSLPRCCRVMHIKSVDDNQDIDLSSCRYIDELIIDSIYQVQFALPIYLSNWIIMNSKYFSLSNQDKLNLHNLGVVNSHFMFFDLNKMMENLDMVVFW